ncbi:SNF2 family N-terminal domain containing protein [Trichomonas vaginalis G3]|uniref:SNF2 family N-terminal domain containing protein n=1 Tax=Trichomonas vaginalis (strain ATCC PRA-98 / G3) TaxID=412133 RepID=A2EVL5_TRIV3|nr:helicase protein [Trichomonas vaginalis G3]EAY03294.1 SNF2 family N-terminal domain containing protein [Trichomonas vaginalis G3]KAI5531748.1 helicase protein [Trichomonas vaginalis G3]|eukprot:XP_001315517.1 SNF2 family N-terminal domain containing protein [Trichomonas vaginalis G3]
MGMQYGQNTQFANYVEQVMRQRNIPPHYLQDPAFRLNFFKSIMPPVQPRAVYPIPPPQQPFLQKKKRLDMYEDDDDDEIIEEEPSSEEAEFTDDSETSESEINSETFEDYQPTGDGPRRTAGRERHTENMKTDDDDFEEEEEQLAAAPATFEEAKIEHIYVSRVGKEGLEYLVRFQDAKDCLCQWIPESLLLCLDNANYHLSRFRQAEIFIDENFKDIVPIAFRRDGEHCEILYRFSFDQNILLYWDDVDQETLDKFVKSRRRIDVNEPSIPHNLPDPPSDIIMNDQGGSLREYQLQGLKWLSQCWRDGHGSILADEMGLGKTIQVLSFLTYLDRFTDWHGPFLITVRTNTFKQWCEEIEKWTHLSYIPYNSGPQQRKMIREFQFPYLDDNGNPIPNTYSFNILLVSYDVFLKDTEFLSNIKWQVLIVDEGHRIKNSEGKKNNAMKNLNALHRIILTGTPVQNTLQELWTLLNFVSPQDFEEDPDFLQGDIESLAPEKLQELRSKIRPLLLRRTLAEAERTIAPKDEKIAFVSLTNIQRELIRLIQLHSMWRLKGIQIDESTVDTSHESASMQKVCCHPFLIEGAEEYYTKRLNLPRIDLIRNLSTKFIWVSKVLEELKRENHKVLIFSQKVQLLHILREFCMLSGYNNELLIGEMSDIEKADAIDRYSKNPDSFVFLISTRAGSEGLNLTVADTAIIFDPDWNPQNDLQAQARVHRIGQTQKVDVLRLITYNTYEHEMFIRAQKKLGLWMDLLGENATKNDGIQDNTVLVPPPYLDADMSIKADIPLIEQLSTVVNDFSLAAIPKLEKPLEVQPSYSDGTSDEQFLAKFPVVDDDGSSRRIKRSHTYDSFIDSSKAYEIWDEFRNLGYGKWDQMTERFQGHSSNQLKRFCHAIIILCFRALSPINMTTFPFLIKVLQHDVLDFSYDILLCSRKGKWIHAVSEDNELSIEVNACKPLKDTIYDQAFEYLSVIEMKLIAKTWLSFSDKSMFDFTKIPPRYTKKDPEVLDIICAERGDFDPFDERVQAIINYMRGEIIQGGRIFAAQQFDFWSQPEFLAVAYMMKNFTFSTNDPISLHVKTALCSKTTEQVVVFVNALNQILIKQNKRFPVILPPNITMFDRAPEEVQTCKGATSWTQLAKRDFTEITDRMQCLRSVQMRVERLTQFPETTTWSNYHTKKLFELLLEFGFDQMKTILLDKKIGLIRMLNKVDRRFVEGKLKQRIKEPGAPPDFALTEEALINFMRIEDCDDYFERLKYQQYEYVQPGQHVEYNWDDDTSDESDGPLPPLPDDEPELSPRQIAPPPPPRQVFGMMPQQSMMQPQGMMGNPPPPPSQNQPMLSSSLISNHSSLMPQPSSMMTNPSPLMSNTSSMMQGPPSSMMGNHSSLMSNQPPSLMSQPPSMMTPQQPPSISQPSSFMSNHTQMLSNAPPPPPQSMMPPTHGGMMSGHGGMMQASGMMSGHGGMMQGSGMMSNPGSMMPNQHGMMSGQPMMSQPSGMMSQQSSMMPPSHGGMMSGHGGMMQGTGMMSNPDGMMLGSGMMSNPQGMMQNPGMMMSNPPTIRKYGRRHEDDDGFDPSILEEDD